MRLHMVGVGRREPNLSNNAAVLIVSPKIDIGSQFPGQTPPPEIPLRAAWEEATRNLGVASFCAYN